jgi:hypothetical protein
MILFILQNAYTSEKHPFTNKIQWYRELLRSHTGRRLKEMIPNGAQYRVINATSEIGDNPNSVFKGNMAYVSLWIKQLKPDIIVACGKIAQQTCCDMKIKYMSVPHPAWRQLSKQKTTEIKNYLSRF